ncbi:hypothetical protein GZ212_03855 [Mangrovimonas sp. CR14]|uniref:hypothetical protein n=1 Tax=Mangrovimonas sp. CR14 TaxID=2706120 RepID=UPI00141EE2F8|nr:hypothetical protein [Mangrovimonas sp. CR14]NIK91278.1 hypothetical protein [Mangrovimonas sp. CR14]
MIILSKINTSIFLNIILLFCFLSACKNERTENQKKSHPKLTQDYQLDFLKDVLIDTSIFNLKHYQNPFISQRDFKSDETRLQLNEERNFPENIPLGKFIAIHLEENDTLHINSQLDSMNRLDMRKLKSFGIKYIEWEDLKKYHFIEDSLIVENLVSKDSIKNLTASIKKDKEIWITKPVFNKQLNKAYIELGNKWYFRHGILYEKVNNKWIFKKIIFSRRT